MSRLASRPPAGVPMTGEIISMVLSLAATTVLSLFLTQRVLAIRVWSRIPPVVWLVFAIYIDSYVFVFATAMLQHSFGVNSNLDSCSGAILLCLVCYVTTKIFIYLFLVEKAHIVRGTPKHRMHSKLYLFNSFGMLGVYIIIVLLNFIFRTARFKDGTCIIGMKSLAMIPLISFDTIVNVYLTILFLIPLGKLHSFKHMPRSAVNLRLRTVAVRTFCGAVFTLISSIVNLSVLMALDGEPGWVCLMSCNCDILFSAIVIQWVTSRDNAGTSSSASSRAAMAMTRRDTTPVSRRTPTPCSSHPMSTPSTVNCAACSSACRERASGCTLGCTLSDLESGLALPPSCVAVNATTVRHHDCKQGLDTVDGIADDERQAGYVYRPMLDCHLSSRTSTVSLTGQKPTGIRYLLP